MEIEGKQKRGWRYNVLIVQRAGHFVYLVICVYDSVVCNIFLKIFLYFNINISKLLKNIKNYQSNIF
jgi:hypothetical protein